MSMSKRQDAYLNKIVMLVEKVRAEAAKANGSAKRKTRTRRTAADAAKIRKDILSARAKGVAATKLAEKYGVSTAYIYMIKE